MSTATGAIVMASPVHQAQRIGIIDSLRGFVILGILLMNIPGFAVPGVVAGDPSLTNELGTIKYKLWFIVDWLPEGTQRAIFSMLFGAGIILFTTRLEERLDGVQPADYFIRRQLWLLVFGLVNIYVLLWWGDVLFDYALCGMIMFAFRKLPPKKLLAGAVICTLLMIARENRELYLEKSVITKGEKIAALDTTKVRLSDKQIDQLGAYTEMKESGTRAAKEKRMKKSIRQTTGTFEDVYNIRTGFYQNFVLLRYTYLSIWDILLFMFAGMMFFKTGVLTGDASSRVYWIMAIGGLVAGLLLSWYRLQQIIDAKYTWFNIVKKSTFDFHTISRILRTLGIFGTLMLLYKSGWFKWLFALMRPVGQMAFTNYLTQSLICGIIFYGPGFGQYGQMQRYEYYLVVACIWVLQIIWSHVWLHYFYFGPLEWCWRSLTYWKRQPMRKQIVTNAAMA